MPFSPELIKNILSKCPICGLEEPCPLHSQKTADFREGSIDQAPDYELAPEIKESLPQMTAGITQNIKDRVQGKEWTSAGDWTAELLTLDHTQAQTLLDSLQKEYPDIDLYQEMTAKLSQKIKDLVQRKEWIYAGYRTADLVITLKHFREQNKAKSDKIIKSDIPPLPITKKY